MEKEKCDTCDNCTCHEEIIVETVGETKTDCCPGGLGLKTLIGLIVFLGGLLLLGKNLSWWELSIDLSFFWPAVIIVIGLSILLGKKIAKYILALLLVVIIFVLLSSIS